jgi:hypothetical protein
MVGAWPLDKGLNPPGAHMAGLRQPLAKMGRQRATVEAMAITSCSSRPLRVGGLPASDPGFKNTGFSCKMDTNREEIHAEKD